MGGRFFLGVGSGENLNEHVVGRGWPSPETGLAMLEEAVTVLRLLWEGGMKTFRGRFYTVEDARLYTRPDEPPPLMIAASKPGSARLAARAGDAMINTEIAGPLVERFKSAGGERKPRFVEMTVCWAKDERRARATAREVAGDSSGARRPCDTSLATGACADREAVPGDDDATLRQVIDR
jgi:coenzyme F420-dependent glucose-6-phosphate dehydrogenase